MPSVRLLQKDDYICIVLFMLRDMDSNYTFSYVVIFSFANQSNVIFIELQNFFFFFFSKNISTNQKESMNSERKIYFFFSSF